MLHYKNNILSTESFVIDSHDSIITLTTDIPDCNYFGALILSNKVIKTLQFTKVNNTFKARLVVNKEELNFLDGVLFKLISVSTAFSKESNLVKFNFNKEKIALTVKQTISKEILEVQKRLTELNDRVNTLALNKIVPNVNIINKNLIKPGMMLVAVDEGNFMAAYPFADIVTNVNGQQAVDGLVEIDASMIKYNQERTIKKQLEVLNAAFKAQLTAISTIQNELNKIKNDVGNLTIKVETHLDNGII
jgi:hypothetical protein